MTQNQVPEKDNEIKDWIIMWLLLALPILLVILVYKLGYEGGVKDMLQIVGLLYGK